ncbi:N-(5'-phosphoribosyl)anthranilate isomerase [Nitratireductor aestuarii]|uniref:N-(5'-phosphoribosyl)anthranilate isomerase n=1 Tax=Nitratireductor aestuarii TaxID=1735103 RepID=A0A916RKP6_9HYPH|nr:phosphoribosylanthranilate isomerase [Nitratireductor aestuarii]GGA57475.1 N-(5'-phosphoribosyl)anthranilate isomerase [Nitratireductor aestuarii]
MTLDIKICGLKSDEAVAAALESGASHIGFIFFEKSPRHISIEEAARLREAARGKALAVAVTVDADDATLDAIVSGMKPDILQLHGHETADRIRELKSRHGLPVIKALSIREASDLDLIKTYLGVADRFLLDAKPPAGADLPGGNGVAFDWTILTSLDANVDYMLSGGVNAGNIASALRLARPSGVDVSSGVENAPGEKDPEKIRAFFRAVRAITNEGAA